MSKFMDEYTKGFIKEFEQFSFMCGARDRKILVSKYRNKNLNDFVRLACIAMLFDYRKIFLKIVHGIEKDIDDFINGMNAVNGKILYEWIENFIENVQHHDVKELICEFWKEQKLKIDFENFDITQYFSINSL